MGVTQGEAVPAFQPVRDLVEEQFANGQHIGAGVCVYHRGIKVLLEEAKATLRDVHEGFDPYVGGIELPEPSENEVGLAR